MFSPRFCYPVLNVFSSFAIILARKREQLVLSFNCLPESWCSVALPRGAVGWSPVCECGTS